MKNNDLIKRQLVVLQKSIDDYHQGRLSLNSLVQNIEGVNCVIDDQSWSQSVFPILLILEQINASYIEFRISISDHDLMLISDSLSKLEFLITAKQT